jgi:hypothetical protein
MRQELLVAEMGIAPTTGHTPDFGAQCSGVVMNWTDGLAAPFLECNPERSGSHSTESNG